jgi:hypothetical protein
MRTLLTAAALALASASAYAEIRPHAASVEVRIASDDPRLSVAAGTVKLGDEPLTGTVVVRASTGRVTEERGYREGMRDGEQRAWWDDGSPRSVSHYAAGLMDGETREWDAQGHPFRLTHYRAGRESGEQKLWNGDGTLRANYVVVDGRRFGRLGATGCTGTRKKGGADAR